MTEELKDVTDSLELVPVTDLEVGFVLKAAEIEIQGKEVLEQALAAYQKKYAGYIVTEETLSDDIKVKDELGRVQRQIEQELKNQLSEYSKPLDEAKAWVESILDPIKTLQIDIKNQIKEFEERETEARKETVRKAFESAIAESGTELDIKLFAIYFDDFSKKKCFMADNVRINQATSKMIVGLVAEEAAKKQQREAGLIQITEAAAKAGLGPTVYIRSYDKGAKLADVLQAILDDKVLAERTKAETELKKRIDEMTAIAVAKGLNPEKYVDLLREGRSALDTIDILHADADELRRAKAEAEQDTQGQLCAQNQPEFGSESSSGGNHTIEQETGRKSQNMASEDGVKKYGYKFTVDLIFPAENAKEIKEQFKEWLNSHGVRFEPKSKSVKVEME
ncbi:DUF1351 domain-containing protein [Streptococcus mitis]|uniref:Phage protein n=1 Tax=Streptococcus mitis TaxID=28037 RepID=A0A150NS50_STRMT|nr:DUF1351 domain-containing protein [Streptococcus mitis]KYF34875.1 Phage protein [Streptococcus mitis]KYF36218.1 Phage protein [Streptococcus mitis]QBX26302.1 hypothetical protein Javan316_0013 [Streptococcus phage Javan316]